MNEYCSMWGCILINYFDRQIGVFWVWYYVVNFNIEFEKKIEF